MLTQRPTAKLLPALVFAALAGTTFQAQAQTAPFTGVYVFGDSLSDAGYYRPGLSAIVGPQVAAAIGRFTTNPGPTWSEIFSQRFGAAGTPSNVAGGNIYAQGGQRVALPAPASLMGPGGTQRPVSTQITEYLSSNGGVADNRAIYTIWAGANDVFTNLGALQAGAIDSAALQANVLGAAAAEIQQIGRLRAAGARYVMVFALPDIGLTPQFAAADAATRGAVSALSAGYNTTLWAGLAQNNISVIPVDAYSLLGEIRANAAAYGFTNITSPACLPAGSSSLTCSAASLAATGASTSYLFADGVHPTTGAHRVVADYALSLIEGPHAHSLLAEAPLRSRESHVRTVGLGANAGMNAAVGKISAFASGDGGTFEVDASSITPRFDTEQKSVTAGITMRASEAVTVGLAIGKSENEAKVGSGSFDTDETTLSAFASARSGGLYANFVASVADIKYDSIRRNIPLGIVTRTASASTDGANSSGYFGVGYNWDVGKFSVGPFVSVLAQNVTVTSFSEEGAGSANLRIGDQKRASRVVSGGLRASVKLGAFTPFVRVSFDQEQKNNERLISALPLTPIVGATGNSYSIPGYVGDKKWTTGTIGVNGMLGERIGLGLMYSTVSSRDKVSQDSVTANVSFQF